MLKFCDIKENSFVLEHGDNVFHDAIEQVKNGIYDFWVKSEDSEDYGLKYIKNNDVFRTYEKFDFSPEFQDMKISPDFLDYSENKIEDLCLDIFDGYDAVFFNEVNEYSITIAKLLLKFSDIHVYTNNYKFNNFIPESNSIKYVEAASDVAESKLMVVIEDYFENAFVGQHDYIDSVLLFHNIFIMQYMCNLATSQNKKIVVPLPKIEGIGSILNFSNRIQKIFDKYGLKYYMKSNCTRYKDELLKKYFNLSIEDLSWGSEEKIYADIFYYFTHTAIYLRMSNAFNLSILNRDFLYNLEEYKSAVFGNKKMLGVLVRGSDYILTRFPLQPLKVDKLIGLIKKIKTEGDYQGIFLATEDKDYFEALRSEFGDDLIAISQNRVSVNDLKDYVFISEYEKAQSTEETYQDLLENDLINYFYALYLLSQCNGFLASPGCSGPLIVNAFNEGKFEYSETVSRKIDDKE